MKNIDEFKIKLKPQPIEEEKVLSTKVCLIIDELYSINIFLLILACLNI